MKIDDDLTLMTRHTEPAQKPSKKIIQLWFKILKNIIMLYVISKQN